MIGTRHDSHAELARKSLERNKNVFVEKPLALNDEQLDQCWKQLPIPPARLMVGFNPPLLAAGPTRKISSPAATHPLSMLYRVNAGRIPKNTGYRTHEGGGRIVGEVCHFVDLMQFSPTRRRFLFLPNR